MIHGYRQQGVSLVELVIIIIVVGIVAVPFFNAFLHVSRTQISDKELTQAHSLARACAEFVLQQRRTGVITATPALTVCDDPVIPGFTSPQETLNITSDAAGAGNCPAGSGGCDLVTVAVNNATATQAKASLYFYLVY
ncbi:MAG: hypothetical protein OEZ43_19945 [Gammaproteobacteria bacterium]|nr:hypothetical protein [Gammaproteobacteria bacterium]